MIVLHLMMTYVVQTVFLVLALWILVRLQDFQYSFLGLLGSAALASALNLIPFVGRPLAVVALVLCLKAVTRTDFVEVRFTVAIAYALLFGVNLFLMGGLGGGLQTSAKSAPIPEQTAEYADDESLDDAQPSQAGTKVTGATNAAAKTDGPAGATAPTALAVASPAAAQVPTKRLPRFAIKGLSRNGSNSLVMIDTGVKTYTFAQGESLEVRTPEGKAQVTLERISDDSVILNVAGQQVIMHQ